MKANAKTTMERILQMEDALSEIEERIAKIQKELPVMSIKFGRQCRERIEYEVRKQIVEQAFEVLKDNADRDTRIYHMMAQMDSMEKSVKDINKKFTAIRKQLKEAKHD